MGGLVIGREPWAPSWLGLAQWQAVRGVGAGQEPGRGAQGLLTKGQCPVCLVGLWRVPPPPVACGLPAGQHPQSQLRQSASFALGMARG